MICSRKQLWVCHERSKKNWDVCESVRFNWKLFLMTEYWEWSIWSPFEQADFPFVRYAVAGQFVQQSSYATFRNGLWKPISCDVKKSSRERLSLMFGYTVSIWLVGCHRNWRTMRTGIIRCVSSRAFADALSCSNSRLFAVRQFDRLIWLVTLNCVVVKYRHFRSVKLDGTDYWKNAVYLNSALKHESRIVSGVGTMWLGRWANACEFWRCVYRSVVA